MPSITDYVEFNDRDLERKYTTTRIPMATFYEAYFDGAIDIPGDIYEFLGQRDLFVKYSLTPQHFKWAVTNFLPEVAIHSKSQDERIVRDHYDRGNDFFESFLGDRMVYTSAFYEDPEQSLEEAQDNKLSLACEKLQLKPGERILDIGCGWGTFVAHAAKYFGADATGVTLAKEQTEFGMNRIKEWGVADRARIRCHDYREIPKDMKFDKIASFEMVEHVGTKNLVDFYQQCYDHLEDDGVMLLQWTGLRNLYMPNSPHSAVTMREEDLIWGLFMNKYIFPGADASLCLSPMLKAMEKGGFEIQTVENVSIHYSWTIRAWHQNWLDNKEYILEHYGERWFRIWHFFLAWSSIIAEQGNAACFQVVMNKNLDAFQRDRWVVDKTLTVGQRAVSFPSTDEFREVEAPAAQ